MATDYKTLTPEDWDALEVPVAEKRGRGRPKGSKNKVTLDREAAILKLMALYPDGIQIRSMCYRLVDMKVIEKKESHFDAISSLLKDMRWEGKIPWDAIVESHRSLQGGSAGYDSVKDYINSKFTNHYFKDYWQAQPKQIFVIIEKAGLLPSIHRVCYGYSVNYAALKGYPSLTLVGKIVNRGSDKKENVILYLGDFDPSGLDISRNLKEQIDRFLEMHNLHKVRFTVERVGLNSNKVTLSNGKVKALPTRPIWDKNDPRNDNFEVKYGPNAVELDALDSVDRSVLPRLTEDAIKKHIDWAAWQATSEQEKEEKEQIDVILKRITDSLVDQEDKEDEDEQEDDDEDEQDDEEDDEEDDDEDDDDEDE